MLHSYKELFVWRKGVSLVQDIYRLTASLPASEQYGLIAQMRRAAVSIPANIAEGYQRRFRKEYIRFIGIAEASAAELETYLFIVHKLYPSLRIHTSEALCREVQKMFLSLQRELRRTDPHPDP